MTDLRWWLKNFKHSAFRLETLPAYQVPQEAEWFAEWQRSGKVPELRPENDSWCKLVSEARSAGRLMQRVRVVSSPLSDYERFELTMFRDSVAAGEVIRVLNGTVESQDFWMFDNMTALLMLYDPHGCFLGIRNISGEDVTKYCRIRDTALSRSISLQEYLARL